MWHDLVMICVRGAIQPITRTYRLCAGLSFSNYSFTDIELECPKVGGINTVSTTTESFNVSLSVTNHGKMDGKTVVQVYFSQNLASRVRFSKMLLSFAKVTVQAGRTYK